ncbi:MAG: hypothetical protein E7475_07875 [Ruminococcaceae bacterium]|nr:hypothetical protein [Oscillospiraceae bacterium]
MLKAGFSRMDVTPPLGSFVAGDFSERYSKTVLDPLYLNALALSYGDEKVLIIACDFLFIQRIYCDNLRAMIGERVSIPADNVMLCSLHQHSSIMISDKVTKTNNVMRDTAYLDVLNRKFGDVAAMAMEDLKEAELGVGIEETAEQIAFIRRYYMKDGTIATNPIGRYLEVDRPYAEADNNVRLLRFKRKEGNDIAFVNFSTHPDVIHRHLNSADWPGFVRRYVEQDIPDTSCIVTVGVQGDSNHCDFTIPQYKDGYEHCQHMGRVIADTVVKIWDKTEPAKVDKLSSEIYLLYNRTRTEGEETYEEAVKLLDDHYSGRVQGTNYTLLGIAQRVKALRDAPIYQKVPISVINLGEIGFVGFGGEPFTRYAEGVRNAVPGRFIIASCNTNGGEGYLPIKEAFEEGGYEAGSSPFSPNLEEDCVNKAVEMLNR